MNKRLQVPLSPTDEALFKSAAKKEGLSTADWARRHLKESALMLLKKNGADERSPREILKEMFSLNAPVSENVNEMIEESFRDRYR